MSTLSIKQRHAVLGIDNGVTGSMALLDSTGHVHFFLLNPTKEELHYGKTGGMSRRLDRKRLAHYLFGILGTVESWASVRVICERPMTGKFFKSVSSGLRFHEGLTCFCEDFALPLEVIDSRDWQKPTLGAGLHGKMLKKASALRGAAWYPMLAEAIRQHGDADGLLIAHWAMNRALHSLPNPA